MSQENETPLVSCSWIQDRITLLPSDDLPREDRRICRAHLRDCHSCRREFGVWFGLRKELQALRPEEMAVPVEASDAHFFEDLKRDVLDRVASDCDPVEASTLRTPRWRWVASAAAAGVLFAVGLHFGRVDDPLGSDLLHSGPLENPSGRSYLFSPNLTEPVGQPSTSFGPWEGLAGTSKMWIPGSEPVLDEAARKALAEDLILRDRFRAEDAQAVEDEAARLAAIAKKAR